jgi:hypothetical protein
MKNNQKRLLQVYPHDYVCQLFKSRTDMVFLDESGWWLFSEANADVRKFVDLADIEIDYQDDQIRQILSQLDWWAGIWYRWVAHADQYELLKREALFYVLRIMAGLKEFGITTAVFHTGISHHVDISLVEIACSRLGVDQIFLYSNVVNGRLLPMIQSKSILDRRPLGVYTSEYDATSDIQKFISNKKKGKAPTLNGVDSDLSRSFMHAHYSISRLHFRSYLGRQLRKYLAKRRVVKSATTAQPLGLFDHIRLIKGQKKALDYYNKNCLSIGDIQKQFEKEKNAPLIAAHYQPEATSFPEGGNWGNHVDIALKLRALKVNSAILYKEHPSIWMYFAPIVGPTRVGMARSVQYYEQLLDLGCKFVPPNYDLNMLNQSNTWYFPITITGTISIERSLFGLPTVYAGQPWYQGLPGTSSIHSLVNWNEFCDSGGRYSVDTQNAAEEPLRALLSNTTLLNRQGLGSGRPLDDDDSKKVFEIEFTNLVNGLLT